MFHSSNDAYYSNLTIQFIIKIKVIIIIIIIIIITALVLEGS
jgi:hypothetical protein